MEKNITLRIIVRLSERQKAIIIGRGDELPCSPLAFKMNRKHAQTIAEMKGKFEVSDREIYAGFGGFESQLHIPYKMNLGDRIGSEIAGGNLKENGNIDYIMIAARAILNEIAETEEGDKTT